MQLSFQQKNFLRYEDIPDDDEALLEELTRLVDDALLKDTIWSGRSFPDMLPETPEQANPARKKPGRIAADILFYGLLAVMVAGAFFISRADKKPVFGFSLSNVLTWSMEPEIPQGALVVIRETDPNLIQISDDVTYMKDQETSVTHRVIGITEDFEGSGERGFETQGIANDTPDFEIVQAANVVGVVQASVPLLGSWLAWLRGNLIIVIGFTVGIVLLMFLLKGALRKSPDNVDKVNKKARKQRVPLKPAPQTG